LVYNDEFFPAPIIDEEYRKLRKKEFGRTADVESVAIRDGLAVFRGSHSGFNIYETSIHFSATERYRGVIYVNTWNHLMSTHPSPPVLLRYGYKEARPLIVRSGTREDAEEFARRVGDP